MSTARVLVALLSLALFFGVGACKKKDGDGGKAKKGDTMEATPDKGGMADMAGMGSKGASGKPKLSAKDNPKDGDSCKGLGAADGVMACDGNTKLFCSSFSKYKWKKLGDCKGGTKCVLGANGKSVSCK